MLKIRDCGGCLNRHREKIFLVVIIILGLVKLVSLNGGVVLGEPDEVIHLEVLRNFRNGDIWPVFAGKGWYYNFPLFLYLGWPLSYLLGANLLTYRVVSVLFSLLLALGIYFYLRWKVCSNDSNHWSKVVPLVGAVFWSLCPLAVYYSRLGLIEMMVTSLMFLALFSFDYVISEKKIKWSVASGVLLSLAVLTKYTAFIFVAPLVLVWMTRSAKKFPRISRISHIGLIDWYSFVPLAIAGAVTLVTALVFYQHDGFLFKFQAGASLGIFTDWWKNVNGGFWDLWWQKTAWWVGWPVLVLAGVGLAGYGVKRVKRVKGVKKYDLLTFVFLVTVALVTTRKPFNPRYFLPVVPFLCVWAALGLEWLLKLSARGGLVRTLSYLSILGLLLPGSYTAFQAANHTLIEEAGRLVASSDIRHLSSGFLFSNWWPTFFENSSGLENATWLAESVKETQEFADTSDRSALTILDQDGGVVLLEQLYSKDLYTPNVRLVAQDLVERNVSPTVTIKDFQPNFPFYRENYNEIKIYLVKSGQSFP
ncbi:MAG: glycosyltransferase family 39 protein [bacterium]